MKITEKVTISVIILGLIGFTLWVINSLYIPALSYLNLEMGVFGFMLGLSVATLFTIFVWAFFGIGISYLLTAVGAILGMIAEGLLALRNYYKRA